LLKLGISLFFLFTYSNAGIPLPGHGIAQSKGLTAGMGVGTLKNSGCKSLWSWASQGNYSYSSNLSGGISIKFLGGNLDSANNLVNQRYSVNAKFKSGNPTHVLFLGPVFSFESINLSSLRKEFTGIGIDENDDSETKCSRLYADIGSSIGYQIGAGFLLTPNWGVSVGHNLDLTFTGTPIAAFSSSVAFNLREQFEKFKSNTENLWLSIEYSASMSKSSIVHNFVLGLALGF